MTSRRTPSGPLGSGGYGRRMPTRQTLRRWAVPVLLTLGLTGCVAPKHQPTAPTAQASSTAEP